MNAAFRLAQKLGVDCVIFHDVDMFPHSDLTPYGCPDTPLHLGAFVNTLGYKLLYKELAGGALSVRMSDYLAFNGYSNIYFGWGGEVIICKNQFLNKIRKSTLTVFVTLTNKATFSFF